MDIPKYIQPDSRIAVLGGGISGTAVLDFLRRKGCTPILIDRTAPQESAAYFPDSASLKDILPLNCIVKSPGISPEHEILKSAKELKIPVFSEIELAKAFFRGKTVGITGTDGKSTTTSLTAHIIKSQEPKTEAGGNIGKPFIEICEDGLDFAVLELSSYQLEDSGELHMDFSAILNLAPDHLERHKTMENYARAKWKISDSSNPNHILVLNEKLKSVYSGFPFPQKTLFFGKSESSDAVILENEKAIRTKKFRYSSESFPLFGYHNLENLAAAILLSESAGMEPEKIQNSISSFTGLSHRFEKVHSHENFIFINDSKSTNLHSMLSGTAGNKKTDRTALILGGRPKNEPLEPLFKRLTEMSPILCVYGEAAEIWKDEIKKNYPNAEFFSTVEDSLKYLKTVLQNTETHIIFSPACASFDQYKNFEERGNHFKKLVQEIWK